MQDIHPSILSISLDVSVPKHTLEISSRTDGEHRLRGRVDPALPGEGSALSFCWKPCSGVGGRSLMIIMWAASEMPRQSRLSSLPCPQPHQLARPCASSESLPNCRCGPLVPPASGQICIFARGRSYLRKSVHNPSTNGARDSFWRQVRRHSCIVLLLYAACTRSGAWPGILPQQFDQVYHASSRSPPGAPC